MPQRIIDTHVHTDNSPDGHHSAMYMCECAEMAGLRAIAFTDHVEADAYRRDHYDRVALQSFIDVTKARWAKFDTLAHMTYPLRYIVGEHGIPVDMSKFSDKVDEILSLLVKNEKALEINTSGLRQKLGKTMPEEDVVRRFKQLGGEFVTVGSDAHYAKDIGAGVNVGMEIAQRSGFDCVTLFQNRMPVQIPIE